MKHNILAALMAFISPSLLQAQTAGSQIALRTDSTSVCADHIYDLNQSDESVTEIAVNDDGTQLFAMTRPAVNGRQIKDKVVITCLDANTLEQKWQTELKVKDASKGTIINDRMLITDIKECSMMNLHDGTQLWHSKMSPVYCNRDKDIIVGYKSATSPKLIGCRMSTGGQIWESKIPHDTKWGWDNIAEVDSNRIIIIANDVNMLDITTGTTLTIDAKTGVSDTKSILLQGLVSLASAVATAGLTGGAYSMYPAYGIAPTTITDLSSDVLCHDSLYYVSDRTRLVCFDSGMNIVWEKPFEKKTASKAILTINDGRLMMLNLGFGIMNGLRKKCGRPFVAVYDLKTGEEYSHLALSDHKDIVYNGINLDGHCLMTVEDAVFDVKTDSNDLQLTTIPWEWKQHGVIIDWANAPLYAAHDDDTTLNLLTPSNDSRIAYVGKDQQKTLCVYDSNWNCVDSYPYGRCYKIIMAKRGAALVMNPEGDTWITHELGMPTAHLTCSGIQDIQVGDEKTYISAAGKIYAIATDRLLK